MAVPQNDDVENEVRAIGSKHHVRNNHGTLCGESMSLSKRAVCELGATGKVLREVKVASEPEELIRYFNELDLPVSRIGLEAGPLSQWLQAGLVASGRDAVLLETRHVKATLSAMTVKTDRKDARGIAQLLRMGWYRPVHAKSVPCKDSRALLVGRKLLQGKLLDVEPASARSCAATG